MSSISAIGHCVGYNRLSKEQPTMKITLDFSHNTNLANNIKIIGHRGNQGFATENSRDAILDCSRNNNIDGTEFDIRPTKDDKIVIMHNATVNGTTSSKGRIQDLTLEELKKLRFTTQVAD